MDNNHMDTIEEDAHTATKAYLEGMTKLTEQFYRSLVEGKVDIEGLEIFRLHIRDAENDYLEGILPLFDIQLHKKLELERKDGGYHEWF